MVVRAEGVAVVLSGVFWGAVVALASVRWLKHRLDQTVRGIETKRAAVRLGWRFAIAPVLIAGLLAAVFLFNAPAGIASLLTFGVVRPWVVYREMRLWKSR